MNRGFPTAASRDFERHVFLRDREDRNGSRADLRRDAITDRLSSAGREYEGPLRPDLRQRFARERRRARPEDDARRNARELEPPHGSKYGIPADFARAMVGP